MASKSILVNLGLYVADNNIRRNLATYTYNFSSPTASSSRNDFILGPGDTLTVNTSMAESAFHCINTSSSLSCTVNFSQSSGLASYAVTVRKLMVLDSDVRQFVLTNPSLTESAKVTIFQS